MGKIYRTAQGRQLDMEAIRLQNELVPALGNMRVNARGDQLGPGGKVVKTREMIMDEYYKTRTTSAVDNIPQQSEIPTRSNSTRRKSDPIPKSSKKSAEFTPDIAKPDDINTEPVKIETKEEPKLKGGLAAAIAKSKSAEKKVKRID